MIVVLMGVTGSGKTTVGTLVAGRLDAVFADADDYHPKANKEKMAAGIPLNDDDRQPWLEELNRLMREWQAQGRSSVLACSALKAKYRATLAQGLGQGEPRFVWLDGAKELIADRLAQRHHEYMNPNLLASQIATLEPPTDAIRVVNDRAPEVVADEVVRKLKGA